MIWLSEHSAWVIADDGGLTAFDPERLANSIERAAHAAGDPEPWLAESLAAAVHVYAGECNGARPMTTADLANVVEGVLRVLGYDAIAWAYAQGRGRAAIRLEELVGNSGAGFELDFFRRLDAALTAAADNRLAQLQVSGLRACVMQLRGRQRWSTGCTRLAEEIVEYVRARMGQMSRPRHLSMSVAMVD